MFAMNLKLKHYEHNRKQQTNSRIYGVRSDP